MQVNKLLQLHNLISGYHRKFKAPHYEMHMEHIKSESKHKYQYNVLGVCSAKITNIHNLMLKANYHTNNNQFKTYTPPPTPKLK